MTDPSLTPTDGEAIRYDAPASPAEPAAPAKKKKIKWKIVLPIVIAAAVLVQAAAFAVVGIFLLSDPIESAEHSLSSLFPDMDRILSSLDGSLSVSLEGRLTGDLIEELEGHEAGYTASLASDGDGNAALSAMLSSEGADDLTLDAALTDGRLGMTFPLLFGNTVVSLDMKTLPDDLSHSVLAPGAGTSASLDRESFNQLMDLAKQVSDLYRQRTGDTDGTDDAADAFDTDAWEDALHALRLDLRRITRTGSSPMIAEVNGKIVFAKTTVYEADETTLPDLLDAIDEHILKNDALTFPDTSAAAGVTQSAGLRETLEELVQNLRKTTVSGHINITVVLYESFGKLVRVDVLSKETFVDSKGNDSGNHLEDVMQLEITPGKNGRLHFVTAETQTVDGTDYCNLYLDLDYDRARKGDTLTVDMKAPSAASSGTMWMERTRIEAGITRGKKDAFSLSWRLWKKSDRNEYPEIDTTADPTGQISLSGTFRSGRHSLALTLSDLSVSGRPTGEDVLSDMRVNGQFLSLSIDSKKQKIDPLTAAVPLLSMSAEDMEALGQTPASLALLQSWNVVFNGHLMSTVYETAGEEAAVDLGVRADGYIWSPVPNVRSPERSEYVRYDPSSNRLFVTLPSSDRENTELLVLDGDTLARIDTVELRGDITAFDAYDGKLAYSSVKGDAAHSQHVIVMDAVTLRELAIYDYQDLWGNTYPSARTIGTVYISKDRLWVLPADQWCSWSIVNLSTGAATQVSESFYSPLCAIDRETGTLLVAETGISRTTVYAVNMKSYAVTKQSSVNDYCYGQPYFHGLGFIWEGQSFDRHGVGTRKPMRLPSAPTGCTYDVLWMDGEMALGRLTAGKNPLSDPSQVVISDNKGIIRGALPETDQIRSLVPRGDGSFYLLLHSAETGTLHVKRLSFTGRNVLDPH